MEPRLMDVLQGKEDNYILPFNSYFGSDFGAYKQRAVR